MDSSRTSKSYILKQHFDGLPTEQDFEVQETVLPPVKNGEFLIESHYLSVDPYMRLYVSSLKEGSKMIGVGVGKIIESKNDDYPVGSIVTGPFGWTTHVMSDEKLIESPTFRKMPSDITMRHTLGVLGLTGMTAYFGFLDICTPKAGETVFVNTAAGAVGNVVGQIAKLKGCHVVGCAGSEEKLQYLKEIGFDEVFNYKTADLEATLKKLCPKGIDCFFDNVGGDMFDITLRHMNRHGRLSLCGFISMYNEKDKASIRGVSVHGEVIPKELKIQGFIVTSFYHRFDEAFQQLQQWVIEGKIKVRDHVVEGFENMPKGFISLFSGFNIGKVVIKVK